jgi:hypothetical protein
MWFSYQRKVCNRILETCNIKTFVEKNRNFYFLWVIWYNKSIFVTLRRSIIIAFNCLMHTILRYHTTLTNIPIKYNIESEILSNNAFEYALKYWTSFDSKKNNVIFDLQIYD